MKRLSQLLAFALGGVISIALLQSLSACAQGQGLAVSFDPHLTFSSIDTAGKKEADRFYATMDKYSDNLSETTERDHFRDAFRRVRSNYVAAVSDDVLVDAAIKGIDDLKPTEHSTKPAVLVEAALDSMLSSLDPHSQYLSPDELKERRVFASGEFGGLGIQVTMEDGFVKVIAPIEDTPADRAGIKAGDLISHLNGNSIKDLTLSDAVKIMRGRVGTKINITIIREGANPFDVSITRAVIHVRSVRWRVEKNIGYIRVSSFTEQTEPGLKEAFAALKKESGSAIKGYVLDLRNNPGGLLDQAVILSDMFLDEGEIVSIRPRRADYSRAYMAEHGDMADGKPLVVLINEGSASASEIVAGALKDNYRAAIMGRRSFGKGSVQTIQQLPLKGALQLTTALYYFPSGKSIQALGVLPDIVIDLPPNKDQDINQKSQTTKKEGANGDKAKTQTQHILREADLPGSINAQGKDAKKSVAHLDISSCPGGGIDEKDKELGCAIAYINSSSADAFLVKMGGSVKSEAPAM
ncbi:MAG: S41 family peptidase [Rhodospirillaceae bacterium]|nr:S41 family peptidase [Rhodospirillaceae bacterium]